MKPPKGAGERVYPNGRMDVGTGPKPTAAERLAAEVTALYPPSPVPKYAKIHDIDDDARWQAVEDAGPTSREVDERIAAKLRARETSDPRVVEPDSIDSDDLAGRDRPSAAEAHAADLSYLRRLDASLDREIALIAEVVAMDAKLGEMAKNCEAAILERDAANARAQRPRQHGIVSSLLTLLRGDR